MVQNMIIIGILAAVLGLAAFYVIRAKKNGQKCIGCPNGKTCSGSCGSCNCQGK